MDEELTEEDTSAARLRALCFNQGSEARIRGYRLASCPYYRNEEAAERKAWQLGWFDVHNYWGMHVKGRWRFRELVAMLG